MRERFIGVLPRLALAAYIVFPSACGPNLNWKDEGRYEDCGFEDKGIPKNHLIIVQKQTRFFTPDRFTVVEDLGVQPVCLERIAEANQTRR